MPVNPQLLFVAGPNVAEFKRYGYTTNLVYLTLNNIQQSTNRVDKRVKTGGHNVDLKNIQPNFEVGLQCLARYAHRFDNLDIVDASKNDGLLRSLLQAKEQRLIYLNDNAPEHLRDILTEIVNRMKNNPRDNPLER